MALFLASPMAASAYLTAPTPRPLPPLRIRCRRAQDRADCGQGHVAIVDNSKGGVCFHSLGRMRLSMCCLLTPFAHPWTPVCLRGRRVGVGVGQWLCAVWACGAYLSCFEAGRRSPQTRLLRSTSYVVTAPAFAWRGWGDSGACSHRATGATRGNLSTRARGLSRRAAHAYRKKKL